MNPSSFAGPEPRGFPIPLLLRIHPRGLRRPLQKKRKRDSRLFPVPGLASHAPGIFCHPVPSPRQPSKPRAQTCSSLHRKPVRKNDVHLLIVRFPRELGCDLFCETNTDALDGLRQPLQQAVVISASASESVALVRERNSRNKNDVGIAGIGSLTFPGIRFRHAESPAYQISR